MEPMGYATLYNFFSICGSPSILLGSPVFFRGLVRFLVWVWVWVRDCLELFSWDPVQDFSLFLERFANIVRVYSDNIYESK